MRRRIMIKAQDIMTREVITVSPETRITQAAKILIDNHLNGLPVVDKTGGLKGIICQNDLIFQQKKPPLPSFFTVLDGFLPLSTEKAVDREVEKIAAVTVGEAMSHDPVTITPETSLEDIATLMVKNSIHTLPVLDKGKLVGIIGKEDVLRTLMPSDEGL